MRTRILLSLLLLASLPFLLGADLQGGDGGLLERPPVPQYPPNGWTTDTLTPTLRWQAEGHVQVWVAAASNAAVPVVDVVLPPGTGSYTLPTPLVGGAQYRWKLRTNPLDPASSIYTWSQWSTEWSFTTVGNLPWNKAAVVRPVSPQNGTLASSVTPVLSWQAPPGATYYEVVLTPAGNERNSIRFVNTIADNYRIPGPPVWYMMMPDTTYYWRVRVNNATGPVPDDHPSWGPWSEVYTFRTPVPTSDLLGPVAPASQAAIASTTPRLAWSNPNDDVFYYEVQVSRDPNFVTDPARSVAPVYWETVHGGMSTPRNSYQISERYPLQRGQNYFWRVRAAMPGSQREAPWGPTWSFRVD